MKGQKSAFSALRHPLCIKWGREWHTGSPLKLTSQYVTIAIGVNHPLRMKKNKELNPRRSRKKPIEKTIDSQLSTKAKNGQDTQAFLKFLIKTEAAREWPFRRSRYAFKPRSGPAGLSFRLNPFLFVLSSAFHAALHQRWQHLTALKTSASPCQERNRLWRKQRGANVKHGEAEKRAQRWVAAKQVAEVWLGGGLGASRKALCEWDALAAD